MQYLAGLGLNLDDAAAIYAGMLAYRRFPEDLFVSAEGRVDSLREAIRRQHRKTARIRPALMASERVQCRRLPFADLAFASPQDDRIVIESRRRAANRPAPAGQRAEIPAGRRKSELAPAAERFRGARGIEPAKIFARPREGDIQEAGFVARPARSPIAVSSTPNRQGRGRRRRRPSWQACLQNGSHWPGWLSPTALRGAHARKHDRPDGHVRQVALRRRTSDWPSAAGSKTRTHRDRAARSIPLTDRFRSGTWRSLS